MTMITQEQLEEIRKAVAKAESPDAHARDILASDFLVGKQIKNILAYIEYLEQLVKNP
jgi:hypothetical protein